MKIRTRRRAPVAHRDIKPEKSGCGVEGCAHAATHGEVCYRHWIVLPYDLRVGWTSAATWPRALSWLSEHANGGM